MDNYFRPGVTPNTPRGEKRMNSTMSGPADTPAKKCQMCGFRIRGQNHEEGYHHKKDSNFVRRAK